MERKAVIHTIGPFYTEKSSILILGSFPSVKSREENFFYAHKMNRFWPVLSSLFNTKLTTIEEKIEFLTKNNIALWDVIGSCTIEGSGDQSIRDVVPNNLSLIIDKAQIKHIYVNGQKAYNLYLKYNQNIEIPVTPLPSTSPANATFKIDKLIEKWSVIIKDRNQFQFPSQSE